MNLSHRSLREERSSFGEQVEIGLGRQSPDSRGDAPREFLEEMYDIKRWAMANEKSAKWDLANFWLLKIPAILVSASAATLAHYRLDAAATFAAGMASACVLIDGLRPRGLLHAAHSKTSATIYNLHARMASEYRQGRLNGEAPKPLAARILKESARERAQINEYIIQIESSSLKDHSGNLTSHEARF
jgi:hypothetical protein